jgi:purine-nucleoside phosphorylase
VVSCDPESTRSLALALASIVDRLDQGLTFTTSSVVCETNPDFWSTVDKQCRAIDMGAAAFYAAARATGKRAAAYFWVTDLPLGGKSFFDPSTPEETCIKQDRFERTVLLDLELLIRL